MLLEEKRCTIQLVKLFSFSFLFSIGSLIHCVIKSNQSYLSVQSTQQNVESSCHFKLKRKYCNFWVSEYWAFVHVAQGSSPHYSHESTLVKVQLIQNCSGSISCQLNPAMYPRLGHISAQYSDRKTLSDHQPHKGSCQLLQHQLLGEMEKIGRKHITHEIDFTLKINLHFTFQQLLIAQAISNMCSLERNALI